MEGSDGIFPLSAGFPLDLGGQWSTGAPRKRERTTLLEGKEARPGLGNRALGGNGGCGGKTGARRKEGGRLGSAL